MNREDLATKKDLADGLAALENKLLNELASKKELSENSQGLAKNNKGLAKNTQGLAEANKKLDEHSKLLAQNTQGLAEANKKIDGINKELAEVNKKLDEHSKLLAENSKNMVKNNDRLDKLTVIALKHSDAINSMQETLQRVAHNQDLFMETLTDYSGEIKDYRLERVATDATFSRHSGQLQDHEQRIHTLEEKIAI